MRFCISSNFVVEAEITVLWEPWPKIISVNNLLGFFFFLMLHEESSIKQE